MIPELYAVKKILSFRIALLLLILFLLPQGANSSPGAGLEHDSFYVSADLGENTVFISQDVFFNAISQQTSLKASLAKGAENIKVYIDDKRADFVLDNSSNIVINLEQPISGKHFLHIDYTSSYPLSRLGERFLFRYDVDLLETAKGFTLLIKLPLGYTLPKTEKSDMYYLTPEPDRIYSDGSRTSIVWRETEVSEEFSVSVIYEGKSSEGRIPIGAALVIAMVGTGILILYLRGKRASSFSSSKDTVVPDLIESERTIVDILSSAPNRKMKQRDIQEKSGFSKAKLSRVLRNLEERKVIVKKPSGNTNEITLVTDV